MHDHDTVRTLDVIDTDPDRLRAAHRRGVDRIRPTPERGSGAHADTCRTAASPEPSMPWEPIPSTSDCRSEIAAATLLFAAAMASSIAVTVSDTASIAPA